MVNSLALSPLLYLASVIHVPEIVIKEVKCIIVDFIWDGKPPKIAYDVLIQQIFDGGLKLTDFESKVKSLKSIWVNRLTDETHQRWKAAPKYFYKTSDFIQYFSYNQGHTKIIPKFYEDVHNSWSDIQKINTISVNNLINQTIWNNRYITIEKNPFLWQKWQKLGINKIKDIIANVSF